MEKVETLEISKQLGIRKKKSMRQLESPPKNDECSDMFVFFVASLGWIHGFTRKCYKFATN